MIRVEGLARSFRGQSVLKGINLEIPKGQITAIIGRSGCGKTVFLKHLIVLLRPDRGKIFVDGTEITGLKERSLDSIRRRFGVLFQGAALLDSLSLFDNVALPLREKTDLSEKAIREKVEERLEQVGLHGMEGKFPAEVSGGMKKRAGLARALIMDPDIVLFDEPTTGLDPIMLNTIHRLIANTQERFGYTAVMVSHEIPEVFSIAHRIAMMEGGVIIEIGDREQIVNSSNAVVVQFLKGETEGPIKL
jgi:phospholipid/cholesterol/gamma-HCH transport system ATP-binding protein